MSNVVSLGPIRDLDDDPTQLELYRILDDRMTNSLGIWDKAPWYVIYTAREARNQDKFLDKVVRSFPYGGRTYQIAIRPARIDTADGEIDEYPGEREQLVELTIRKLAAQKARVAITGREVVSVQLGLYEIYHELERKGHKFNYDQIRESLAILHRSNVEISRTDFEGSGKTRLLSEAIFPTLLIESDDDPRSQEATQVIIHFNALVADAIKKLNFWSINYDTLMALRTVARWLYLHIHHELVFERSVDKTLVINAMRVYQSCGMGKYTRDRDALDRVSRSFKELADYGGIIEDIVARPIFEQTGGRPKKVDIEFEVTLTDAFMASAVYSRESRLAKIKAYQDVEGEDPRRFIKGSTRKKSEARRRVKTIEQNVLPFKELSPSPERN